MNLGNTPPQAIDFEEAIIGALMLDKHCIDRCTDLTPQMFFKEEHRLIFETILDLIGKNKPIDLLSVSQNLKDTKMFELAGGFHTLAYVTSRVSSAANVEYHKSILIQKFIQRETMNVCHEGMQRIWNDGIDPFKEKDLIIKKLEDLNAAKSTSFKKLDYIVDETLTILEKIQSQDSNITGIDTGYFRLNNNLNGWQNSDLVIIGARPATGKTAFCLNLVTNIIKQNIPCAVFSLEMSSKQLVDRLISNVTNIEAYRLKSGDLDESHWTSLHTQKWTYPLYIDDTASLNILDFKARARRMVKDLGVKFIVVDYLQLMTTYDTGNREQQLGSISRGLKATAKELNVPIISLAQLSRDVEKSNRLPMLSDLRESGSIEQDADIVMFLHNNTDPMEQIVDVSLVIAKHRAGQVGIIDYEFQKGFQRFVEKIKY
jgi:replicative DNA helicase